jgi:hypothetical protein
VGEASRPLVDSECLDELCHCDTPFVAFYPRILVCIYTEKHNRKTGDRRLNLPCIDVYRLLQPSIPIFIPVPYLRRYHLSPSPTHFLYHILVILVFLIFRMSWKTPYMSASLVGGHPGT